MSKMVQIRDIPDDVHTTLKARAGISLSDLIKRELERTAQRPGMLKWLQRTRAGKTNLIQSKFYAGDT